MDADTATDAMMIELSVIVATYNRAHMLRACLESLCRQTQPAADFEVIVVVDGSTDDTRAMLAGFAAPYTLRVYWQRNSGHAVALNNGIRAAAARYCLILDDDIIADPGLVAHHLRVQRARPGVVGLGHLTCRLPRRAGGLARYYAEWWGRHYAKLDQGLRSPSSMDCFSGNLSAPRASLLEVGGFAVDLPRGYDVDLGYRLERRGLSVVYIPEAIGHQDYRKGSRQIEAGAEQEGASEVELYRRHPALLPHLRLAAFGDGSLRATLLRHALLALGCPPRSLAMVGPLLLLTGRRPRAYEWYRFLYSYCYWRGARRAVEDRDTWRRLTRGTPILMYHAFGRRDESASRYVVPAHRFARQMAWLAWRRYRVLSLEEFLHYRRAYRLPPARSVVITFDDGYADNRTVAYPVLRRHGFPATIFLVSGAVGGANVWDRQGTLAGRPLLSWPAIREMARGGISYGAHTRTHAPLTSLPARRATDEVEGSRVDLERALGLPIVAFAYPYGEHDQAAREIAERAGFLGACGIRPGGNIPATPLFALHRTEIYGVDSLVRFALALALGHARGVARLWAGQ